jgi:hypothetical protein
MCSPLQAPSILEGGAGCANTAYGRSRTRMTVGLGLQKMRALAPTINA